MELNRNVEIIPDPTREKDVVGCQCEIGREKLLTAPPYRFDFIKNDDIGRDISTAPATRELELYKCPISQILVTFKSPVHPNEVFSKVFPASTPIKFVKRKLAKLLSVSNSNLLLTKNRNVLKESSLLSDLKTDALGNLVLDVLTKNSEVFSLSSIPVEYYVYELLKAVTPKKRTMPFIAIKFRVHNQNATFTRSYHSIMKVHEVKKNLGGLFQVEPDHLVLLREDHPLLDRMALLDLDFDKYGIVEVELITKNKEVLNLEKLYREMPYNDVLSVNVQFGNILKKVNVEIFSLPMKKPYLGGYKNIHTGTIYHHAYTQTPQKPEKLPPESKSCRDTQTAEEREKIHGTSYSRATQMTTPNLFIPNVADRIVEPKPYETFEEMKIRLNHDHYAAIIQRSFRHHQFRQKVDRWLKECMERIARMKEEDRLEREAMERRLRRDLITKTFPKTREDFDQLYAIVLPQITYYFIMYGRSRHAAECQAKFKVDRWKHAEISRISRLHSKGPKIAEFTLLLDKEVELLRCIESYRVKVKEDSRKIREQQFLDEISKPIAWYGKDEKLIQMETVEIQRARKLKELYKSFIREDLETKERLELLVDMKYALAEFRHPLAEEIITLLDRECDLVVRRCNDRQLDYLRRRIAAAVLQFIKTSELNSGVTKCKDVRDYRKMENSNLHYCELCNKVKPYTDFPLDARMSVFTACKSCSWKDVNESLWVDMTPYKFILRAVQRDERRRKCWGSVAFVLHEKDIFFIVEKLWHSHSAISECRDVPELRLCRWNVLEDWSPWNCFLVTVAEMKAHLKLENPEEVYDEELVQKVRNRHKLAKANFEQMTSVNKHYTETGAWQGVRAPAVARVDAVEPL